MDAESAVAKGWLMKKAGILKSRCWFWLVGDKLMYSKTVPAFDGSAKFHAIDLSLAHQVRKTDSPFSFEIVSRKEHVILIAATQAECDDWVKTLQVAMQSHRHSTQVWHSSASNDDALRSSTTGCAATSAGLNQGPSVIREDNVPAAEQLFQSSLPDEHETDRTASCGAPDVLSDAPVSMADVDQASGSCHVLAKYPTTVDLAAHLARKKTLLHRYEDINSPEEERTEVGGTAAGLVCEPSDKQNDRHSRRSTGTTHELVVLEDKRTTSNGDPPKRFSIHAGLKAENSPRDSFVGSDVRLKGIKNTTGAGSYEEIILEDERTTSKEDPPKRFSIRAGLKADKSPIDSSVGSDVRLKGIKNTSGAGSYEEIILEGDVPQYLDKKYDDPTPAAETPPIEADWANEPLYPTVLGTFQIEDSDSSAVYSQVNRQPQTTTAATYDVTSSDVPCTTVSHAQSEQPLSTPQFYKLSRDEQQQVQVQRGCEHIGTSVLPGLEEQPPLLPLPRPAVRIVETEDDVYAKLNYDCKNSTEDSSRAAAANDQLLSKKALSVILADELTTSDAPRVRAYRPQPYSHAVSMLKEHLVREGAFGMGFVSHRL